MTLDWSKLKPFADNKINVTQKQFFVMEWVEKIVEKEGNAVMEWVEKIVEKEGNAGYQHLFLFPQSFQKLSF